MTLRHSGADVEPEGGERLDKWLWAARFYRTRTLAVQAIVAGHVRINGERAKPSQMIRAGSRVTVRKQELTWDIEVAQVSLRRGSAADAAMLYRETPESITARERALQERRAARAAALANSSGRPTKRDRRKLEDFLNEP